MKNLKKILAMTGILGLTTATTINITACSINSLTSNFEEITNWDENNGEVNSLTNDKNTIYISTKTTNNKGNLLEMATDDAITLLPNWDENNGQIKHLLSANGTTYAVTKVTDNENKLFKISKDGTITPLANWKENNGEIDSLLNVSDTVYVGTKTADNKGNLFKITKDDNNSSSKMSRK